MTAPNTVLAPIEKSWNELNQLIESLGPNGLTLVGADGWAVKDHLFHIAAWERSLIALLDGSDMRAAMGVGPEVTAIDDLNAAIRSLHCEKTPDEALAYSRESHARLIKLLGGMSDADLKQSYNHFQPNDPRDSTDDRPVLDWVAGDTYEHYAEHINWIDQLVTEARASR